MKKYILCVLIFFSIISCTNESPDVSNTFPSIDYSNSVNQSSLEIFKTSTALEVLNLLYNEYNGFGEYEITGTGQRSENSEQIIYNLKKIRIYNVPKSKSSHIGEFYIDFINEKNETLTYCYKWQYHYDNIWENSIIKSNWGQNDSWYLYYKNTLKNLAPTRTNWRFSINREN